MFGYGSSYSCLFLFVFGFTVRGMMCGKYNITTLCTFWFHTLFVVESLVAL